MSSTLGDEIEGSAPHGDALLADEPAAIQVLLAILARQGSADHATAAYQSGLSVALPDFRGDPADVKNWPVALAEALERLMKLQPLEKKRLIEALVRCVSQDEKLSVEEAELLRTVCAVLHRPMPPLPLLSRS